LRWSKEENGKTRYSKINRFRRFIVAQTFTNQTSVSELIQQWPQVIPVFIKFHMACVGCSMSGFETLEDAARTYGINLQQFFDQLEITIQQKPVVNS
jgi:hybrid cluster-associated redox disulfide protein